MEFRALRAFMAVAEELHFGNAAIRLRMAQSPLSQLIRKLEHEIGAELFLRSTRSVELTAAGHALLPHARAVLKEVELAQQSVTASEGEVYGTLRFGFTGVLNHRILPRLTRALRDAYPQIQVELEGRIMTQEAVDRLEAGTLDVAFVGYPADTTRVDAMLIAQEPYGMVVPSDHPQLNNPEVGLADFATAHFVTPPLAAGSALYEDTVRACREAGFQPRMAQQITDGYMAMMLVAAGVGVAYLPNSVVDVLPPGTRFLTLAGPEVFLSHGLAWSKRPGTQVRDAFIALAERILDRDDAIM